MDVCEEGKENVFSFGWLFWIDSEVWNGIKLVSKELKNICLYLRMFFYIENINIVEIGWR